MKRFAYVLVVAGLVAGCSQPLTTREKGTLIGAGVGAGAGAIVGNQVGHTGAGALVGAGVGAVTGAVIGDAMQSREQQAAATAPPPPAIAPPPALPPAAPQLVWVPSWGVYVVQGHDVVFHNGAYYYFHGGRWWNSRAYTGPWVIVTSAPPVIAQLPPGRLHANLPRHCPPGQAKKGRC